MLNDPKNSTTAPSECYRTPSLQKKPVWTTPFLPHADIVRILGKRQVSYTCRNSATRHISAENLLVILVPRTCTLTMDNGMAISTADLTIDSAWATVRVLLNTEKMLKPLITPPLPSSFRNAISAVANRTTNDILTRLSEESSNHEYFQMIVDIVLALGLSLTAAVMIILSVVKGRRKHSTNSTIQRSSLEANPQGLEMNSDISSSDDEEDDLVV